MLTSPIALTNTHSVGIIRDALIAAELRRTGARDGFWRMPVVAETWDGVLNDTNGMHVSAGDSYVSKTAIDAATSGAVAEGGVGGGTGMICHGFKGGIGTASRQVAVGADTFTVGVLVQANHGRRERLEEINGARSAAHCRRNSCPSPMLSTVTASAPRRAAVRSSSSSRPMRLSPGQCARLAQQPGLGHRPVPGA